MAILRVSDVKLSGMAVSVPKTEEHNADYPYLNEKEKKLLIRTTGIESRRIAPKGVTSSDLCEACANALVDELRWSRDDIGLLVFVTQTPDYVTPATATLLQDKLGLSKDCLAFDINLGCSGYVYGLSVVASLLKNLSKKKALLLVGDVSSATISPKDKSAAPIFGDAGSATAVEVQSGSGEIVFNLQTDGAGYDKIMVPYGGFRNPLTSEALEMKEEDKGIYRTGRDLILKGIDVFNFSVKEVPQNVAKLLEETRRQADEVDYYIFHQANKIINDTIKRKLKLTDEQVPSSLQKFGNTSSATIPLTIITQLGSKLKDKHASIILCGFGVGLSWGSAYVKMHDTVYMSLIEM